MKILLLPLWMLSQSFAGAIILLTTAQIGWGLTGCMAWCIGWFIASSIPVFVLSQEYDKEITKKREIEKRWLNQLQRQNQF